MVKFVIQLDNDYMLEEYNQAVSRFLNLLPSVQIVGQVENYLIGTYSLNREWRVNGTLIECDEKDAEMIYRLISEDICFRAQEE